MCTGLKQIWARYFAILDKFGLKHTDEERKLAHYDVAEAYCSDIESQLAHMSESLELEDFDSYLWWKDCVLSDLDDFEKQDGKWEFDEELFEKD
jgi:hypothetical protein